MISLRAALLTALIGLGGVSAEAETTFALAPGFQSTEEELQNIERSLIIFSRRIHKAAARWHALGDEAQRLTLSLDAIRAAAGETDRYRRMCLDREARFKVTPVSENRQAYALCMARYEEMVAIVYTHLDHMTDLQGTIQRIEREKQDIAVLARDLREDLDVERDILNGLATVIER